MLFCNNIDLLISGYIREKEKELMLYTNVPMVFGQIILKFYPKLLFRFGDHREGAFKLDKDRFILEESEFRIREYAYFIYADLGEFDDIGFDHGVHLWSVKRLPTDPYDEYDDYGVCIGVTTEKNDDIIHKFEYGADETGEKPISWWMPEEIDTCHSYYEGWDGWYQNEVITIKLDCIDWLVTYYKNGKEFKKDDIEKDRAYYFAILGSEKEKYQVVEHPPLI